MRDRLDEVSRAYERCKVDIDELRIKLSETENERFTQERIVNQQKLELATVNQKIKDKEEMIDKMTSIVKSAESHKVHKYHLLLKKKKNNLFLYYS